MTEPNGAGSAPTYWVSPSPTPERPSTDGAWRSPGFRSARTRSLWAVGLLAVAGFSAVATASLAIEGFTILDQAAAGTLSSVEAAAYERTATSNDGFGLLVVIATSIAFLAWLSRSVENVPPLGRGTPRHSPRWSMGWWFVPVANLFMPYQVVADLYRRMALGGPKGVQSVAIVVVWWLCWLGQGVVARFAGSIPYRDVSAYRAVLALLVISSVIDLAAAILAIVIVRRIQKWADIRAGNLGLGPQVSGPVWPAPAESSAPASAATMSAPAPEDSSSPGSQPPSVAAINDVAPAKFCPSCGTARLPGARYCAGCGSDLGVGEP